MVRSRSNHKDGAPRGVVRWDKMFLDQVCFSLSTEHICPLYTAHSGGAVFCYILHKEPLIGRRRVTSQIS